MKRFINFNIQIVVVIYAGSEKLSRKLDSEMPYMVLSNK